MPASTPIDVLKTYLDRWSAVHLSSEPADHLTAEEGVRLAYVASGLQPPERIIWCRGPLEIARQLAAASSAEAIGANVKPEIFDHVRSKIGTFAEFFWKEVVSAATQLSKRSVWRSTTTTRASESAQRSITLCWTRPSQFFGAP